MGGVLFPHPIAKSVNTSAIFMSAEKTKQNMHFNTVYNSFTSVLLVYILQINVRWILHVFINFCFNMQCFYCCVIKE